MSRQLINVSQNQINLGPVWKCALTCVVFSDCVTKSFVTMRHHNLSYNFSVWMSYWKLVDEIKLRHNFDKFVDPWANSLNIFLHFNTLRMKAPEMHNIDKKKVILLGAHLTLNFHLERT